MINPTKLNDQVASYEKETDTDHAEYRVVYSSGDYNMIPIQYLVARSAGYQYKKKVLILSLQPLNRVSLWLFTYKMFLGLEDIWPKLKAAFKSQKAQIGVEYIMDMALEKVMQKCQKIIERDGLDLLIIDHIEDDGSDHVFRNACADAAALAHELNIEVLVIIKNEQPDRNVIP